MEGFASSAIFVIPGLVAARLAGGQTDGRDHRSEAIRPKAFITITHINYEYFRHFEMLVHTASDQKNWPEAANLATFFPRSRKIPKNAILL